MKKIFAVFALGVSLLALTPQKSQAQVSIRGPRGGGVYVGGRSAYIGPGFGYGYGRPYVGPGPVFGGFNSYNSFGYGYNNPYNRFYPYGPGFSSYSYTRPNTVTIYPPVYGPFIPGW